MSFRFNPSFGILLIQTRSPWYGDSWISSFNPSFGILLIQTATGAQTGFDYCQFQSLVRDSAHSDAWILRGKIVWIRGFNPSFGILLIQTSDRVVRCLPSDSFNPSFGILLIQTVVPSCPFPGLLPFQSLVRDSAHSDKKPSGGRIKPSQVSIPRSGFCSFRQGSKGKHSL